jgi:hypothetical protein
VKAAKQRHTEAFAAAMSARGATLAATSDNGASQQATAARGAAAAAATALRAQRTAALCRDTAAGLGALAAAAAEQKAQACNGQPLSPALWAALRADFVATGCCTVSGDSPSGKRSWFNGYTNGFVNGSDGFLIVQILYSNTLKCSTYSTDIISGNIC